MKRRKPTALESIRAAEAMAAEGLISSQDPAASLMGSQHVLTIRCNACGHPAWLLFSAATDVDGILADANWYPAVEIVQRACEHEWDEWPDARSFLREVRRAVVAGLGGLADRRAVAVKRSPTRPDGE